jgi:hypothetical protein
MVGRKTKTKGRPRKERRKNMPGHNCAVSRGIPVQYIKSAGVEVSRDIPVQHI